MAKIQWWRKCKCELERAIVKHTEQARGKKDNLGEGDNPQDQVLRSQTNQPKQE